MIFINDLVTFAEEIDPIAPIVEGMWPSAILTLTAILSFMIITIVIVYFAYRPLKNYSNSRKDYISKSLYEAENKNTQADFAYKDAKEKLDDAHIKGDEIIDVSIRKAKIKSEDLLNETRKESARIIETSKLKMEKEKENLRKDINFEAINIAKQMAEKILNEQIKNFDEDKMVEEFVEGIGKK